MNKRVLYFIVVAFFLSTTIADAQIYMRPRPGRFGPRPHRQVRQNLPSFTPTLNISFGYGFPALDKNSLPDFYNAYKGSISQTGPITGAIDYQFSRRMSIGVMTTYNSVSAPYSNFSSSLPAFTAKLNNWSVMLNLVQYMPVSVRFTPYIRTAIGVNIWSEEYKNTDGTPADVGHIDLPDLAYQVSLGGRFNFSKHAGLFVEAGYGKYIVNGGLTFRL